MMNKISRKIKNLGFMNRRFGKKVVHVEAPHIFGEELKRHLEKYGSKCYCLCPENYDYVSVFLLNMTRSQYKVFLKKYYLDLKKKGINLQLHVHLSMFPKNLSYKRKKFLIESAYNFFKKDLNIIPKDIVFGWYASDNDSRKIAGDLGLRIFNEHLHIYDWWLNDKTY